MYFICPNCRYEQERSSSKYPAYCPKCLKESAGKTLIKMHIYNKYNEPDLA